MFAKRILCAIASLTSDETRGTSGRQKNQKAEPADDFFKILQKIQTDYPDKKIIVFELGLYETDNGFYNKVKKQVEDNNLKNVELLDTSAFINCEGCYYRLDFHIKPKGHAILADSLIKRLKI